MLSRLQDSFIQTYIRQPDFLRHRKDFIKSYIRQSDSKEINVCNYKLTDGVEVYKITMMARMQDVRELVW